MLIWCEWLCSRCQELHRASFEIIVSMTQAFHKRNLYSKDGIFIEDIVLAKKPKRATRPTSSKGSKIYVDYESQISVIKTVLKEYMEANYAVSKGTLTMEVCC